MPFGFGIVGCGMISNFHAQAIGNIRNARLVGCYDMISRSADRLAGEQDCIAYHDLDEMLANEDIQIVTICTPSGAHMEPALAATKAGKHVLVEKPLEITLKKCDRIIAACEKANVQLGTIMPSRFSVANMTLKDAISEGRFGKLTLGDTYVKWWRSQEYYDSGGWRGTWALDGGGAYMNQAIHNVDLLYWFMGDVVEVCAMTDTLAHERIEVEDTGAAVVRFANGAIGTLEATTSAYPGLLKKTEIHGTTGTAIVEQDDIIHWEFAKKHPKDRAVREKFGKGSATSGGASDPKAISFTGHMLQFKDFLKSIQEGKKPLVDGHEGRKSVEIILAIYKSSWSGKRESLPLKADPKRPGSTVARAARVCCTDNRLAHASRVRYGLLFDMRIAIASDHAGYRFKQMLADFLHTQGHEVVDFGTDSEAPVDYPDFIRPAATAVANGACERGIVLGGSGNGEAIVANRLTGVRCAVCWNAETARLARAHNDANVISLGQRLLSEEDARLIVQTWLETPFDGGRHRRRIEKIDARPES